MPPHCFWAELNIGRRRVLAHSLTVSLAALARTVTTQRLSLTALSNGSL